MRKKWLRCHWLLLAFVAVGAIHAQEAAPARILFIGNSITYWNDMPVWVMELARNLEAFPPVEIMNKTLPGAYFRHQLEDDSSWSPLGTIRQGGWNIVVLQAHPLEPLQKLEEFLSGAERLAEEARSAGAEPLFFQTYPPAEGNYIYRYEEWSGGNPADMQSRISKAYAVVADRTKARVARIGDAWHWVLNRYPAIGLYAEDLLHPSACGSYLEACVLVAAITGKDPREATWRPAAGVSQGEAEVLRDAAWRVASEP